MPFQRPTLQTIYLRIKADMESRLTGDVKIPRFSVFAVLSIVFAGSIHLAYGVLVFITKQLFPDTAEQDFLERLGILRNITRKSATFAQGNIKITGLDSTLVPAGTEWQDDNAVIYSTDSDATIGSSVSGEVDVNVTAVQSGENGNTSDTSLDIIAPITNVDSTSIVNEQPGGGADEETDNELRQRIIAVTQDPPTGGRAEDYVNFALEVPGVDKAFVFENYLGAGTVGIAISDSELQAVDPGVKANCQSNIDAKRPLGVLATVEDVVPLTIDFNISISPNTTEIQATAENNLKELFLAESTPNGTMLLSRIRSVLGSSGMSDYSINDIIVDSSSIGVADIDLDVTNGYPSFAIGFTNDYVWSEL